MCKITILYSYIARPLHRHNVVRAASCPARCTRAPSICPCQETFWRSKSWRRPREELEPRRKCGNKRYNELKFLRGVAGNGGWWRWSLWWRWWWLTISTHETIRTLQTCITCI